MFSCENYSRVSSLIAHAIGTPNEFIAAIKYSIENDEPIEKGYKLADSLKNSLFQFSGDQLSELFTICIKGISTKLLQACNQEESNRLNHLMCVRGLAGFVITASKVLTAKHISEMKNVSKVDLDIAVDIAGKAAISLVGYNDFPKHLHSAREICLIAGYSIAETAVILFESVPNLNVSLGLDRELYASLGCSGAVMRKVNKKAKLIL